jgi:hypothetical protein
LDKDNESIERLGTCGRGFHHEVTGKVAAPASQQQGTDINKSKARKLIMQNLVLIVDD